MERDHGLRDLRFEGYDNEALAQQVDGLRNGPGSETLNNAARALVMLAGGLSETDRVLREQLAAIGVAWEGEAGTGGAQATQKAAVFAEEAVQPVGESAKGVATQSGEFSHTRNSAPDSGELRGPTQLNGWDRFAGAFGHTTDHVRDVQATNAARDQAVAGLNGYQQGSAEALGRVGTLPVPPGMGLVTTPAGAGTTGQVGGVPGLGGGSGFVPGTTGVPGGPQLTGGGLGEPGIPGTPGQPGAGPGQPGGGSGQPGPGLPGGRSGVGPVAPFTTGLPVGGGTPSVPRGVPSLFVADAAAIAGAGAHGAAVGSSAEKDRLVRGRQGAGGVPGAPGDPEGRGGQKGTPPKGAAPVAAVPDEEARPARNAEKFGAKPGRPAGNAIMQPATGSARDEEDQEHVRKYGIESGDLFEDGRLTAPSLIGDDDEKD